MYLLIKNNGVLEGRLPSISGFPLWTDRQKPSLCISDPCLRRDVLKEGVLTQGDGLMKNIGDKQLCCFKDLEDGLKGMTSKATARVL